MPVKKIYKNEFIKRHFYHMRKVQDNMLLLENNLDKLPFKIKEFELINRSLKHDLDKFSKSLVNEYYKIFEATQDSKIDIMSEEEKNLLFSFRKLHYSKQKHHCEYHEERNKHFSNIDLCEMSCDIIAISEEIYGNCSQCFDYCENQLFVEHEILLTYKNILFKIIQLLINIKNQNETLREKK